MMTTTINSENFWGQVNSSVEKMVREQKTITTRTIDDIDNVYRHSGMYGFSEIDNQTINADLLALSSDELDKLSAKMRKRNSLLKSYLENSLFLTSRLAEIHIIPIACLPKKLFDEFCQRAYLYQFENMQYSGETYSYCAQKNLFRRAAILFVATVFKAWGKNILLRLLFPKRIDSPIGLGLKIKFVDPPEYFWEALNTLGSLVRFSRRHSFLQPLIAASKNAIILDHKKLCEQIITNRIKRGIPFDPCPILYVRYLDVVAIISSFGKLKDEEKVMKWVKQEGLKLCFN